MKIAIVTTHMRMGGIRQSLLNMLNAIKNEGWHIDLFVLTGDKEDVEQQVQGLNISNIYMVVDTDIYYRTFAEQISLKNKLKKILIGLLANTKGREHVIKSLIAHSESFAGYDVAISYANGIWNRGSKKFSGGCEFFVLDKIEAKRKLAWIHSNPKNLGVTKAIGKKYYSQFDKIVNVSNGCKRIFDDICPELKKKSYMFHNVCNRERILFLCEEYNPYSSDGKFRMVTVARLDNKSKRLDRIAECCKLLKEAGKEFEWYVVGDGNDRTLLERLIVEHSLEDYLIMCGKKENPYPYVHYADVYVCTSDYEAFPMVVREAQIAGTPIVTTPIPPALELISEGEDGKICQDFSSEGLVSIISQLMTERERVNVMRRFMRENLQKYEESLEGFYEILGVKDEM